MAPTMAKMSSMSVAIMALMAPLTLAKPLSHSQRTSNTFTNTTLEEMTATDLVSPTPTDSGLGCFETYTPIPDETCGELASDYGIFLSDFEADYAADSEFCETMLSGQGFCASKEDGGDSGYDGTSIVYADATVTLDDLGNPAVGAAVTPAPRSEPEPSVTETTITFSALTTLTYTIGTEGARQERTKVITHTDVQVETFSLLNAVADAGPTGTAASVGTVTRQAGTAVSTVTVHDTETLTTTVSGNASSTLIALRTLKGTPITAMAPEPTLSAAKIYKSYNGNGSVAQGWPSEDQWLSFDELFSANQQQINESCDTFEVARNTPEEISAIEESIFDVANSTGVDSRFILAMMMQSSSGCVRAISAHSSYLASGLMQSPNGANTCNQSPAMLSSLSGSSAANVTTSGTTTPCPPSTIHQMILSGTNGTDSSDGLLQLLAKPDAEGQKPSDTDVSRFYRAARWFNGGGVDPSGDLGKGCCMLSFASDVANRLTGWVGWEREFVDEEEE